MIQRARYPLSSLQNREFLKILSDVVWEAGRVSWQCTTRVVRNIWQGHAIKHWFCDEVHFNLDHALHKLVTSSDASSSKWGCFLSMSLERISLPFSKLGCSPSRLALILWSSLLSQEATDICSVIENASPKHLTPGQGNGGGKFSTTFRQLLVKL